MGIDLTPGFNLHMYPGGGIPFISKSNGSSGLASGTGTDAGDEAQITGLNDRIAAYQSNPTPNDVQSPEQTGTSTGTYTPPAVNPNQALMALITAAIDRLPGQLTTAKTNIQKRFDVNNNELDSGRAAARDTYDRSTVQNSQQFQTNKNQIQDQAAAGLTSLMRLLGARGAGGGSAALYTAPRAVANDAAMKMAGAGQTFGENQQGLDTNWNTYENSFSDSKKKLNDWLTGQLQQAEADSNSTEQDLRGSLVSLSPTVAAAQPEIDRINALRDKADTLTSFNPTYTGETPVYKAPDVASYTVAPNAAISTSTPTQGMLTPALATLLGFTRDKKQLNSF